MLLRLEALELAANASTDEEVRLPVNCIQVRGDGSVIATDGHHILRMMAAVDEPGLFDALLTAEERGYDGDVLINAEDAKDFKSACRRALTQAGKDGSESVHIVVAKEGDHLTMATADGVIERRFVIKTKADAAQFPLIERVLPATEESHVTLSVDLLLKICRTLKKLKVGALRMGLHTDPNRAIRLSAKALNVEIDGAIMPMRTQEDAAAEAKKIAQEFDATTGEIFEAPTDPTQKPH